MKKTSLFLCLFCLCQVMLAQNGENGVLDSTTYDWQSNSGARNWTKIWPDGKISFAFTVSSSIDFSDRGTAICGYDAITDIWTPSGGRVEDEQTNFGSIAQFGENGLVIASHTSTAPTRIYIASDKDNIVPNTLSLVSALDNTYNPCWPAVMTSGPSHNIIHVVANANGHTDVPGAEGAEQPIIYFRSIDGGQSWDKQNVVLPFMGNDYCLYWSSNSCYWMETTDDNCLALVVNNGWSDGMVLYSYDDGETWERKVFYQHPNPFGFNELNNEMFFYPRWTSCQWDNQHRLHVLYEYNGHRFGDTYSDYPQFGGVAYWNEAMPYNGDGTSAFSAIPGNLTPGEPFVMDSAYLMQDIHRSWFWPDRTHGFWPEYFGYCTPLADDGFVDDPDDYGHFPLLNENARASHGNYWHGICAFPVLCEAGENEWVAIWCGLDENHEDNNYHYYYHLFASYSRDNGTTWTRQVHLSNSEVFNSSEMIYPQAAIIGNKLIIAVQEDGEADAFAMVEGDTDPNDCYYHGLTFDLDKYFGEHTITATAMPVGYGSVAGAGTFAYGEVCTLTATPNTGCAFVNWTRNDTVVSTNAAYTFRVEDGGDYVANFVMQNPSSDFQSGDLLYSIISMDPPRVSLNGHIDGQNAQGELIIPQTVSYQGSTYTVTKIGYEAFDHCANLTGNLVIPQTVDTIMTRAFAYCSGFTGNLVIPNSVRYLGGGAFGWCYGFDGSLILPEGIPAIYSYTFEGCTGLTGTLNIPSTVTSIGPAAFGFCTGFTGTLVIPESVVEISTPVPPVNGIRGAFEECTGLTGLVLPESLRIIGGGNGGGCFAYCTGLTGELVIPNKVKEIGYLAFYDCNGLTGELHLPDSLEYIGSEAFSGCTGFTGRLVFPDALETIDNEAFARCSGFSEVDLNHQVFYQNNFGDAVFVYWSMENVELPEGCTATGKYTFRGCGNLRTVHLPESLTKIDYDCFQECSSLTNIIIPESVTIIETGAFDGCISLTSMELPVNLSQLGGFALRNCTSLTGELVVPDLVERIEQLTFAGCTNLNRIVLGSSVNTINDNAFKDIVLDTLVIKAMTPPVMRHFVNQKGLPLDQLVVVPCGTLEAYQNAEGWSDFTNIIEDCDSGLVGFSGTEWYYEILNLNGTITYQHLEYAADTTVNHKNVQIIIRTNTLYDKSEHVEVTREYVYEEDGVVYWWNKDLQEFSVLYDYNAEVGSEWEIKVGVESIAMHVDAVEQYYYDGRLYRMLRVSDAEDLFSGTIVCGIGHLSSFFPEKLMTRGKGYRVEGMRCYWRNGELVFKYGEEDCDAVYMDYHFGLDEQKATAFAIYPNPTHGVLVVETQCLASHPTQTYCISNVMGQTLMPGVITAETQRIDVTNLPQGMYFISIGDQTRKFVVR